MDEQVRELFEHVQELRTSEIREILNLKLNYVPAIE